MCFPLNNHHLYTEVTEHMHFKMEGDFPQKIKIRKQNLSSVYMLVNLMVVLYFVGIVQPLGDSTSIPHPCNIDMLEYETQLVVSILINFIVVQT
jgi:hypothetical protein